MPPAARGTPTALALGPGYLHIGPLDAIEPTDLVTPWETVDPNWVLLGYTETGSEFNYALATGEVVVAEELDPVFVTTTGRTGSVVFNMAELTASHLSVAMNGGIIDYAGNPSPDHDPALTNPDIVVVEPPDLGREMRYMFGFESEDHSERWLYRQCFQSGTLKIARAKGNTVATIATTFSLEKPATGKRLFAAILNRARRGGWLVGAGGGAPIVSGVNPAFGPAAGNTPVTVSGANLGGATAITFGGAAATAVVEVSATTYTCQTTAHAAGVVDVAVTTPSGTGTLPNGFEYQ